MIICGKNGVPYFKSCVTTEKSSPSHGVSARRQDALSIAYPFGEVVVTHWRIVAHIASPRLWPCVSPRSVLHASHERPWIGLRTLAIAGFWVSAGNFSLGFDSSGVLNVDSRFLATI